MVLFASLRKDRLWREPRLMNMLILSGIFHFLAISLLFFLPGFPSSPYINPFPQYTPVRLISLKDLPGSNKAPEKMVLVKKAKKELRIKKPTPIQKQLEVKKIEVSKVVVPKKSIVPKKISPVSSKPDQKKREKKASPSYQEEEHLQQAIRNIKEKVTNVVKAETYSPLGIKGGTGTSEIPEMVVYTSIVVDRIMEAWFLPPKLKQEALLQNLLTIIDIRIDREGKVYFQGIERGSGNVLYDNYALAAIKKIQSESFPPLPEVFRSPYLDLGIRFKPSGVDNL
jgi:outer membrane biosynthesis protein TonB